jgi:CheY-like chemotaxis protein
MSDARALILIVEDDPDLRELLELILTSKGFEVRCCANGRDALESLERRRPDLILLDMKMPVMDGWEFCRALAERGGTHPPIVVVTAAPAPAERAAEVNAQGWLEKPFEYERVEAVVGRLLPG